MSCNHNSSWCIYLYCLLSVQKLLPLVGDGDSVMQEAAAGCISNIRRLSLANQKTKPRKWLSELLSIVFLDFFCLFFTLFNDARKWQASGAFIWTYKLTRWSLYLLPVLLRRFVISQKCNFINCSWFCCYFSSEIVVFWPYSMELFFTFRSLIFFSFFAYMFCMFMCVKWRAKCCTFSPENSYRRTCYAVCELS